MSEYGNRAQEKTQIDRSRSDRYLMQNMDWLEEELGGYEDDYLIIDCPGAVTLLADESSTEGIGTRAD